MSTRILTGVAVTVALATALNLADAAPRGATVVTVTMAGMPAVQQAKWTVRCKDEPTVISYGTKAEVIGYKGKQCIVWAATETHKGWLPIVVPAVNKSASVKMHKLEK